MLINGSVTQPLYNIFGVVTGTVAATQFLTGTYSCQQLRLKANPDNIGTFFIGNSEVQEWPLDAGQETQWVLARDLSQFYFRNPSGTLDYLLFWLQR